MTYDLSTLRESGDTLAISPTLRLTLRLERDPDFSINDYEGDGTVHEDCPSPSAVRIETDRGYYVWWEPYDNVYGYPDPANPAGPYRHSLWADLPEPVRAGEIARVTDILRDGAVIATLQLEELLTASNGTEHWTVIDSDSIGGLIGDVYPELLDDMLANLSLPIDSQS